ncbi:DUF3054 domain-containing protein [Brevibacillus brevis]|uniref:DUF3054 domain-containing protein n=1 Tax=Brevibacillus brevis TaxID=1393 RepID=UPI000D111491|nr:DUF3054 domain-containing protein [Brevibacillus brevis]PSJ66813.1 DUF3054 domain-containing protein [Brevibacillus brevis]RED35948.1 DUF3054 family protein [Brevibacillus brevis]GEC88434.1 hypothetical protein BBR01nite_07650 [Brevibacillus brevis]VEF88942.1 Protein of uncharacterised function (DUF3054) [Brevibacillus brevis]
MRLRLSLPGYLLLLGDLIAFVLFVYYGKIIHNYPVTVMGIIETLAPFLVGWIVAILLFKSYGQRTYESAGRQLLSVLITWTVAAPIGLLIRSWWTGVPITLIFAGVTYFITLAFLLGWRVPFAIGYAIYKRNRLLSTS